MPHSKHPELSTTEQHFARMQQLYEAAQQDNEMLASLCSRFNQMQQRMEKLKDFYQTDWLKGSEALGENHAARERLHQQVGAGYYSILGEDTIWNLLSEREELFRTLQAQLGCEP